LTKRQAAEMTLLPQYYLKKCKNGKKIQACGWRRVFKNLFFYMGEAYRKVDHPKRQQQHHSYNT
jgi:hypothetical protein